MGREGRGANCVTRRQRRRWPAMGARVTPYPQVPRVTCGALHSLCKPLWDAMEVAASGGTKLARP